MIEYGLRDAKHSLQKSQHFGDVNILKLFCDKFGLFNNRYIIISIISINFYRNYYASKIKARLCGFIIFW